jgi:nucleotide-binding universal stress UspA family protein
MVAAVAADAKTGDHHETRKVKMYKKILVPLDGSKRAEAILPHVEEMAQRYGVKVIFLTVVDSLPVGVGPEPNYSPHDPHHQQRQVDEAAHYLAGVTGEFREKGIKADTIIEGGPVIDEIIDVSMREDADLIAMASHGRTGLSRAFYGSVAAGVLHRVDRPLFLVRAVDPDES